MKLFILALAFSLSACAQQPKVFTVSGNFPRDLYGPVDLRGACCWGNAASDFLRITFPSKPGYRVHILRLRGDLIAWPKVLEGQPPVKPGTYAGVLAGFSTWNVDTEAGPDRTWTCDYCAGPGVPLYIQAGLSDHPIRAPFDYDLRTDEVYLDTTGPDANVAFVKIAAFLNTTGYPIHTEITYTFAYSFEPLPTVAKIKPVPHSIYDLGSTFSAWPCDAPVIKYAAAHPGYYRHTYCESKTGFLIVDGKPQSLAPSRPIR